MLKNQSRRRAAQDTRSNAAELAASRPHPRHRSNAEELRYRRPESRDPSYIASFTKGLPHDPATGLLLNPPDFRRFVLGIQSGDVRDFRDTPLGPAARPPTPGCPSSPLISCETPPTPGVWESASANDPSLLNPGVAGTPVRVRGWESQSAGLIFDLEGPDAQAVTMPPAPTLASNELAAEIAEVYLMALLRDVHFSQLRNPEAGEQFDPPGGGRCRDCPPVLDVVKAAKILKHLPWFKANCCDLSNEENARHRDIWSLHPQGIFRGFTPGDAVGPYLSQFLLIGNTGVNGNDLAQLISDGRIAYGSVRVDQRVRVATPCRDYMTTFETWLDVQNGADLRGLETYERDPSYRFITTPRDLATYVHYDALYEAYLNACLTMLGLGVPFDPGLPFEAPDVDDRQTGFASFGTAQILSLVTEVATRALKAVRYQKFHVHRRLRPEALAGLIDRHQESGLPEAAQQEVEPVSQLVAQLKCVGLLDLVAKHNHCQNKAADRKGDASANGRRLFLPMAFPEGSPMHPSYGAGHATVAGACVTLLKGFFDHGFELRDAAGKPLVLEPNADGSALVALNIDQVLTVEGELNKLAANISIGRDWAGVHYFTDYIESLRLGEQIALGLLEEQRLTYGENFAMTVPLFDGGAIRI